MIENICENAISAAKILRNKSGEEINSALNLISEYLIKYQSEILQSNEVDCQRAVQNKTSSGMVDRLRLDSSRVEVIAKSILDIIKIKSPLGNILEERTLQSGIKLKKITVPIGVIGMVYEARPNVTVDSAVLCLKSGNACILKGSSSALNTNRSIVGILRRALLESSFPADAIQFIDDPKRESIDDLLNQTGKVDLIIPRGGANLINYVVQNSKVPVIETGAGICHVFIEASADYEMAKNIVINAKVQRPAVCNSIETILFDEKLSDKFIGDLVDELYKAKVEVRGDLDLVKLRTDIKPVQDSDWETEYSDLIISCKKVQNLEQVLDHINKYGTKHSDIIITENSEKAEKFLNSVDSACVYWNASSRFSDGGEFGYGAEIGISTQKIHVRGPIGVESLVSYKYLLFGSGQIRS